MNNRLTVSLLALLTICGCQVNELNGAFYESKTFTATIEDGLDGAETRTFLDESGYVRWKRGDQVCIFAGSTVNEQYQVTDDSDGQTSASFVKVSASGSGEGSVLGNNASFYPYASTAQIAKNGSAYVITSLSLPAAQNYAVGSFGNGAFPMAAVTSSTDDTHFKFKNVLGGLKLQLKGTATITSISVKGNNNEILCGAAEVTVSNSNTPSINLTDASAKTVTLDCGEGVALNAQIATSFIIALPPMTMEGGFTVVVNDTEGKTMEIKTEKTQTITRSALLTMPAVTYEGTSRPLTFTSTGETYISLVKVGSPDDVSLEYSKNDGAWTTYTVGESIALADGDNVAFRAGEGGNSSFANKFHYSNYHKFTITGSGTVAASGSVMSLLDQEGSMTIPSEYCFARLFASCTKLTKAPKLPATTLADGCYAGMFEVCTSLTTAPELPATKLEEGCYMEMFEVCTSLTTAPKLPATSLAMDCYADMFYGCTSLTTAPKLPATTLAYYCYECMFYDCTGLTVAPELPATSLAGHCYGGMFYGCTGLKTAPELPATTLADYCYESMFYGCTGLTVAPELPATTLAAGCYYRMFLGCYSLSTAPELPATSMEPECYAQMFLDCYSLSTAPELPATLLADYCYAEMFEGCTNLTTAPDLYATSLRDCCYDNMFKGCSSLSYILAFFTTTPSDQYTRDWVSGVAETGDFIKNIEATWDVRGANGIPDGWTVYEE